MEGKFLEEDALIEALALEMLSEAEQEYRKKARLTIELVPSSCWYTNVRSNVSPSEWEKIKKWTARKAGYVCEVCGGAGPKWPVECHEVWEYDDIEFIQKLVRTIALCPDCHKVKHIGLAYTNGMGPRAEKHLRKVNGWSIEEARSYIEHAFALFNARSKFDWELDLTWLEEVNWDADPELEGYGMQLFRPGA